MMCDDDMEGKGKRQKVDKVGYECECEVEYEYGREMRGRKMKR